MMPGPDDPLDNPDRVAPPSMPELWVPRPVEDPTRVERPGIAAPPGNTAKPVAAGVEALQELRRRRRPSPVPQVPDAIGPYRLHEEIGRGGMGRVFRATQTAPVRRPVALKLLLAGVASETVLKRFESERQALALMNHPSIAQIFDAGTTPEGAPYFVMELVDGESLSRHASSRELLLAERLRLFQQVCEAIQHAHRRGVLHRDIKPSNVLVSEASGRAVPKVIDFGLAKAMAQARDALGEDAVRTQHGMFFGTPSYMSPEQTTLSGNAVDTRSDVYSLGALLYELCTGVPPFDATRLSSTPLDEMVKLIREEQPPRPSRRLADRLAAGAVQDAPVARGILAGLESDLDWVILKALDKEPDRRYGSPEALAEDLERFLRHEPVVARRPSVGYRARRYLRRHAVVLSLVAGSLVAIAGTLGWGLYRTRAEATRANHEATVAREVSDFLVGLFEISNPTEARGSVVTAREILDRGAAKIETDLAGQPLTQAQLLDTMGQVYIQLGLYQRAAAILDRAVELRRGELGEDHLDVATSLDARAWVHFLEGEYEAALPLLTRSLEIREALLGPLDEEVGNASNNLAAVYRELRRYDEAEPLYQRAIAISERVAGADDPAVAFALHNLGTVYHDQGRFAEAEPLHRRALALRRAGLPADHPHLAQSLNTLGWLRYLEGDDAAAQKLYAEALAIREKVFGPAHPEVAVTLDNLGLLHARARRWAAAERYFRRALAIREKTLDANHRNVADSLVGLGSVLRATGRTAQAEPLLRRGLAVFEAARGGDHPDVARGLEELAALLRATGRAAEAAPLAARAAAIRAAMPDRRHG